MNLQSTGLEKSYSEVKPPAIHTVQTPGPQQQLCCFTDPLVLGHTADVASLVSRCIADHYISLRYLLH